MALEKSIPTPFFNCQTRAGKQSHDVAECLDTDAASPLEINISPPSPVKMKITNNRRIVSACIIAAGLFGTANLSQATAINPVNDFCWTITAGSAPLDFLFEEYPGQNGYDYSYSGSWSINNPLLAGNGYNALTDTINSIKVWFSFADDNDDNYEEVDIYVGGTRYWDDLEVDGTHDNPPDSYHTVMKSFTRASNSNIYSNLASDGLLDYSVWLDDDLRDTSNIYGREDTYLKAAKVEVCVTRSTPRSVPDSGSTFLAFGLGLLGLGGVRRFLTKA